MDAVSIVKIILLIPFLIAGGLAIAFLSYIMVPMMIAAGIFGIMYVIFIDIKG